jgi:hypothetical protein
VTAAVRRDAAFNARDIETALAGMSDDVDWPNCWEGGRMHGREAVRPYWTRQWAVVDSRVDPVTISTRADGRIAADVHQFARNLAGEVLWEGPVLHIYDLRNGLVTRMDIEEQAAAD